MMIARIVVNYLDDIKELDEPNHKKQYILFAAGIVLATILLISAHLYSRKRGNQV